MWTYGEHNFKITTQRWLCSHKFNSINPAYHLHRNRWKVFWCLTDRHASYTACPHSRSSVRLLHQVHFLVWKSNAILATTSSSALRHTNICTWRRLSKFIFYYTGSLHTICGSTIRCYSLSSHPVSQSVKVSWLSFDRQYQVPESLYMPIQK